MKCNVALDTVFAYSLSGNFEAAEKLLKKHEALCRKYHTELVDASFDDIHRNQRINK